MKGVRDIFCKIYHNDKMEDLYFENELRNKLKEEIKSSLERYKIYFHSKDKVSETTKQVLDNFEDVLYSYFFRKYGKTKNSDEINNLIETFTKQFTDDKLITMYNEHKFTQEEIDYIKLVKISSTWRGEHQSYIGVEYAIIDILLREKIIEQFGKESLTEFIEIIQTEFCKLNTYRRMVHHFTQLLSDAPYGENIHIDLEEYIEKEVTYLFNQNINCGGYALKIDTPVFPSNQENFSQRVSSILDKFPFVRLLGNEPLKDDEYLVIYRAKQGKNTGHHFVRVDSDATVREKDGCQKPRIFQNWGTLSDGMEALFAVKKEHQMFGYDLSEVNSNQGLDFEESVSQAIREKQNMFIYHSQNFYLKKSKYDEIFILTDNDEIVANVLFDDSECLVEILAGKEEYIENISRTVKPIIQEGKLINYEQFRTRRIDSISKEER